MPAKKAAPKSPDKKAARKPAAAPPAAVPSFIDPWTDSTLIDYFIAVRARFGSVRVLQVSTYKEEGDYHIDDLFVRPALSESHIPLAAADGDGQLGTDLLEVLEKNHHLVVLGDPGSGKSTLVNWLVWSLASTETHRPVNRLLGPLVPVPFILRESSIPDHAEDAAPPDFAEIVEVFLSQRFAKSLKNAGGRRLLNQLHERGQLFFLFDGVDELSTAKRDWVRSAWQHIAMPPVHPLRRGLLTSRIIGYESVGFDQMEAIDIGDVGDLTPPTVVDKLQKTKDPLQTFLKHLRSNAKLLSNLRWESEPIAALYYAAPFDTARMNAFARNWYRLRVRDPEQAAERAAEFIDAVSKHKDLAQLRHSPLLLTFMAIVHNARHRLPDGRVLLYREIVDAYLAKISLGKKLPIDFPPETVHEALSHVAWEAQKLRDRSEETHKKDDEGLLLPETEVCKIMTRVLTEKEGKEPGAAYVSAFLENCRVRTGLLVPRGKPPGKREEHYAFSHLSFQEYFAAMRIYRQLRRDWARRQADRPGFTRADLHRLAGRETSRETFILLFEALSDPDSPMDPADLAACLFDPRVASNRGIGDVDWLGQPNKAQLEQWPESELQRRDPFVRFLLVASLLGDTRVDLSQSLRSTLLPMLTQRIVHRTDTAQWYYGPLAEALISAPRVREEFLEILPKVATAEKWKYIAFSSCEIPSLAPFSKTPCLESLSLVGCRIKEFSSLSLLTTLRHLRLCFTEIADLTPLRGLKNLRHLDISDTPAAEDRTQIAALQKALPKLKIEQ